MTECKAPTSQQAAVDATDSLEIQVGPNLWAKADGSTSTHNGFGPVVARPPSREIDLWQLLRRREHAILGKAETTLREVRASKIHGTPYRWDGNLWGAVPTRAGRYGPEADTAKALLRITAIVEYHAAKLAELEDKLQNAGAVLGLLS